MTSAQFVRALDAGLVECRLCAHYCRLRPGQTGLCQVRHNEAGTLLSAAFSRPMLMAAEPIEKKYLFHVAPGARTLSIGTAGCNLGCKYCINWRESQRGVAADDPTVAPEQVVAEAVAQSAQIIAFTYTEPTIFIEYALEIARLARGAGLLVVAKSNGFMSPEALEALAPWLDAVNIDLKGWDRASHRQIIGGELQPVLDSLRLAKQLGLWLEVTTLLVPGLNDDRASLEGMAGFVAELGPATPWHLLRFFPNYLLTDRPATPQRSLELAAAHARDAGLHYIYCKELERGAMLNTICPVCGLAVLERAGYRLAATRIVAGRCGGCSRAVEGVALAGRAVQPDATLEV